MATKEKPLIHKIGFLFITCIQKTPLNSKPTQNNVYVCAGLDWKQGWKSVFVTPLCDFEVLKLRKSFSSKHVLYIQRHTHTLSHTHFSHGLYFFKNSLLYPKIKGWKTHKTKHPHMHIHIIWLKKTNMQSNARSKNFNMQQMIVGKWEANCKQLKLELKVLTQWITRGSESSLVVEMRRADKGESYFLLNSEKISLPASPVVAFMQGTACVQGVLSEDIRLVVLWRAALPPVTKDACENLAYATSCKITHGSVNLYHKKQKNMASFPWLPDKEKKKGAKTRKAMFRM